MNKREKQEYKPRIGKILLIFLLMALIGLSCTMTEILDETLEEDLDIVEPSDGSRFEQGTPVIFRAVLTEEDVDVRGIYWSSSIDGFLGEGSNISISNLSVGSHRITASGIDPRRDFSGQKDEGNYTDYIWVEILGSENTPDAEPIPGLEGTWQYWADFEVPELQYTFTIDWDGQNYLITECVGHGDVICEVQSQSWDGTTFTWTYYFPNKEYTTSHVFASISGDTFTAVRSGTGGEGTSNFIRVP